MYLESQYFRNSDGESHAPYSASSKWLNAFETTVKLPPTNHFSDQRRCQLIQGHLEHRTYFVNRQLGLALWF